METTVNVEVDITSDAGYVYVTPGRVARSIEFDDATVVDLDELDIVVGVEVLTLKREWPLAAVVDRFHVPAPAADLVRQITNPVLVAAPALSASSSATTSAETQPVQPGTGVFLGFLALR